DKRGILVGKDKLDVNALLEGSPLVSNPSLVWMFPGQGAQHPGMGHRLFETESVFRENMHYCAEVLREKLGLDLCELIYGGSPEAAERLRATQLAQPAIFAVSYSCAQLWKSWGFTPTAMIGHSVGEYVAATLAGVFSLEDALTLLAERARLMQHMEPGGMMAVRLSETDLQPWLGHGVELAAINGTQLCVVSGPHPALEALRERLAAKEIGFTVLHTSHAFHSAMMEPAVAVFASEVAKRARNAPSLPFISSLTGTWITSEQACDPLYWSAQLRHTVRFAPGVQELLKTRGRVLLEVGPGQNLTSSSRQLIAPANAAVAIASLPHAQSASADDSEHVAQALGRLWIAGLEVDGELFYAGERRVRLGLPTYPFQRVRHWIAPAASFEVGLQPAAPTEETFQPVEESIVPLTPEEELRRFVRDIIRTQTGVTIAEGEFGKTFLDLGFDSLVLTQVTQKLKHALKCQLRFRQLLEELSTLNALTTYLQSNVEPAVLEDVVLVKHTPASKPAPVMVAITQPEPVLQAAGATSTLDLEKFTLRQRESVQQLARRKAARSPASSRVLHGGDATRASVLKELDERVLVARAEGPFVWDLDGHRFIDVLPEHGATVFGHSLLSGDLDTQNRPSASSSATVRELTRKLQEFTSFERACIYPSATEAMARALDLARRISGRNLIAVIAGDSHASGGVALSSISPLLLSFGEAALQTLVQHSSNLGGVVIDPVQFGHAPQAIAAFVRRCREIAAEAKCPIIIDETFTALRIPAGSSQNHLGVAGDLAVYAGAIAEGLPIGVVAGSANIMQSEEAVRPGVHALVLARAQTMLDSFVGAAKSLGTLDSRAKNFTDTLNRSFRSIRVPLRVQGFSSLYRLVFTQKEPFGQLLYSYLRERGLATHDASASMLTAAHTDGIVAEMLTMYRDAAAGMRRDGLLGRVDSPVQIGVDENVELSHWYLPPYEGAKLGYDAAGNPVWFADVNGAAGDLVQVQE
ncbi:MAG: acyltransferase domain-containing protein, partial [Povalibacter sp.]